MENTKLSESSNKRNQYRSGECRRPLGADLETKAPGHSEQGGHQWSCPCCFPSNQVCVLVTQVPLAAVILQVALSESFRKGFIVALVGYPALKILTSCSMENKTCIKICRASNVGDAG